MFRLWRRVRDRLLELLRMPQSLREISSRFANQFDHIRYEMVQLGYEMVQLRYEMVQLKDRIDDLDDRLIDLAKPETLQSDGNQVGDLEIKPIVDIPFAQVDLTQIDPIMAVIKTPEFEQAAEFFADNPSASRSLVSPQAQALLYTLIRLFMPQRVVEIGTFMAATTEAIARALYANGVGTLDTIDPFGKRRVRPILAAWPSELRKTTIFHPINSMQFFAQMQERQQQADLIFIDGNHDFEFALFDIESASRFLNPGGFMIIDNIGQPGPFMASRDFLMRHYGWREFGKSLGRLHRPAPYDADRTKIANTDLCVLQAPPFIVVNSRPMTSGEMPFTHVLGGVQVELAESAEGTLHVQCVVRAFGDRPTEYIVEESVDVSANQMVIRIPMEVRGDAPDVRQTAEPWLTWEGAKELRLSTLPKIF